MQPPPSCFLDLPPDTVRLIVACLDSWETAEEDRRFLAYWSSIKLCCRSLYATCRAYEPQLCKAALVAWQANLIVTPADNPVIYEYHELLPYSKLGHMPEQQTPVPCKLRAASDCLRTCKMVRLDECGLPSLALFGWLLGKGLPYCCNLHTLQLSRPQNELGALLPTLNGWLGRVASHRSWMPPQLERLSLCRWPGVDFKALAGLIKRVPKLECLDVIESELTDDALLGQLAPALCAVRRLYTLYFDGNPITDDGLLRSLEQSGGFLTLHALSLAHCEQLTTKVHAHLLQPHLLPALSSINLYNVALTPEDAQAYLIREISVFAPQMAPQPQPAPWYAEAFPQLVWWGPRNDFGRSLLPKLFRWDCSPKV